MCRQLKTVVVTTLRLLRHAKGCDATRQLHLCGTEFWAFATLRGLVEQYDFGVSIN
jgi:hypothetical protein